MIEFELREQDDGVLITKEGSSVHCERLKFYTGPVPETTEIDETWSTFLDGVESFLTALVAELPEEQVVAIQTQLQKAYSTAIEAASNNL